MPYANAVNAIGLVYGAYAAVRLAWRWKSTSAILRETAVIVGAVVLGRWLMMTAWCWSDAYNLASYRFYLLPVAFLSASALFGMHALLSKRPAILFSIALAFWMIYFPMSVNNAKNWTTDAWREYHVVTDYLNRLPDQDFILINGRTPVYSIYKFGDVDFNYAKSNKATLISQKQKHQINDILVFQRIYYATMKPDPKQDLGPAFQLQTIYEKQVSKAYFARISKVLDPNG